MTITILKKKKNSDDNNKWYNMIYQKVNRIYISVNRK